MRSLTRLESRSPIRFPAQSSTRPGSSAQQEAAQLEGHRRIVAMQLLEERSTRSFIGASAISLHQEVETRLTDHPSTGTSLEDRD